MRYNARFGFHLCGQNAEAEPKRDTFNRIMGNQQENIILFVIIVEEIIWKPLSIFIKSLSKSDRFTALSDFFRYTVPFRGRVLVMIVDLNLKLLW